MKIKNQVPDYMTRHMDRVSEKLAFSPKLQTLYRNCFINAYATAMEQLPDGTVFLYTGDIPAMWNRDATQQVMPYLSMVNEREEMRDLIKGVVRRQLILIRKDPYANSFNLEPIGHHYADTDSPACGPWTWEEKYETDTLCFPIRLAYLYWKKTGDASLFDADFAETVELIVNQCILEQHHDEKSSYRHQRKGCPWQDTLQNDGKGYPTKYTGMTWQGFRPSDDATKFGYHIPSNMLVSVILGYFQELNEQFSLFDAELIAKIDRLRLEIVHGIEDFGIVNHPKYGKIYAYETDGYGNYVFADDANVPSLMAIPYLGFCGADDPIYQNTRRFVLSKDNPYYFEGKVAKGVGSPHTPDGYVWHMGLSMQGLTAATKEEARQMLELLSLTDADTGYMHEGFLADDPNQFTREWFSASCSMFAEFVEWCVEKEIV